MEPERSYTDGDNAAALLAAYAFELDPWQRRVVDCWLGRDADGNLTAMTCGIPCPRQNGKNGCIEAFEFYMLLNVPDTHILHTAHQVRTAKRAFNRLAAMFQDRSHPELQEELRNVRRTNGEEMIQLVSGNTIEYSSRSRGGARGFDAITCVIYDEAQELQEEQVEAIMSTLAASPTGDRQMIYAGTPPSPGCPGDVFERVRDSAINDPSAKTAWHEWGIASDSCPVREGDTFADVREMCYRVNPALGTRLSEEFTEQEFATMSPDGFARERLGWWAPKETAATDSAIRADELAACITDVPLSGDYEPDGYGVKFSVDGTEVAVAVCIDEVDVGLARVELAADKPTANGTRWLRHAMLAHPDALWMVDGRAGADALVEAVSADLGDSVQIARTGDALAAASGLVDSMRERSVELYAKDGDRLHSSASAATRRAIGKSGGWGFGGDSAPVEAAALALLAGKRAEGSEEDMEVYF